MAHRELRRHRGQSLLTALLVGIPVLVLVGGTTLTATNDLSPSESVPLTVGSSQALLMGPQREVVLQSAWPLIGGYGSGSEPATPLPGVPPSTSKNPPDAARRAAELTATQRLVGGRLVPLSTTWLYSDAVKGEPLNVLFADARDPAFRGMADLTSGRWPTGADEVVVTATGAHRGLPTSGSLSLTTEIPDGAEGVRKVAFTQQVVGTGTAYLGDPVDLVMLSRPDFVAAGGPVSGMLVDRSTPVTWAEVRRLNGYGFAVASRAVAADPPADAANQDFPGGTNDSNQATLLVAALTVGLLLLTMLLAGPAFAVSAARQRHTLALAASNGARRPHLRRAVLGQALVLGVVVAVACGALGIPLTWLGARIVHALHPEYFYGPFDIPWVQVGIVVVATVVAALAAAAVPARGLKRLDVVAVLRGQAVSPRLHRGAPVVGVALVLTGGIGVAAAFRNNYNAAWQTVGVWVFLAGALALVVGALMTVPAILVLSGRLTGSAPITVRMAVRDGARQRGRAVPTVAAIMAGTIAFTAVAIGYAGSDALDQARYQPVIRVGDALVYVAQKETRTTAAAIQRAHPGWTLTTVEALGLAPGDPGTVQSWVGLLRDGCTPAQAVSDAGGRFCGVDPYSGWLAILPIEALRDRLHLSDSQVDQLRAGAVLVSAAAISMSRSEDGRSVGPLVTDGMVRVGAGSVRIAADGVAQEVGGTDVMRRRALPIPESDLVAGLGVGVGSVVAREAYASRGWTTLPVNLILDPGEVALTPAQAQDLKDELGLQLSVERGYTSSAGLVTAVLFGATLALVLLAALIATALTLTEARPFLATMAAVGATRRTRRRLAGAQAAWLALIGCSLGVLVGAVPGAAASWSVMHSPGDTIGPTVGLPVPWPTLLGALVAIPMLAGLCGMLLVRRDPVLTRRAT
jgi:putative ABC transport system permease protein